MSYKSPFPAHQRAQSEISVGLFLKVVLKYGILLSLGI